MMRTYTPRQCPSPPSLQKHKTKWYQTTRIYIQTSALTPHPPNPSSNSTNLNYPPHHSAGPSTDCCSDPSYPACSESPPTRADTASSLVVVPRGSTPSSSPPARSGCRTKSYPGRYQTCLYRSPVFLRPRRRRVRHCTDTDSGDVMDAVLVWVM